MPSNIDLKRISDCVWEIPQSGGMRVPARVYADDTLMQAIRQDASLEQAANVAHLPGIVKHSLAMPDMHWGYGFPIGGVAATDPANGGVVSPGGVGYDINCGVRLVRTDLTLDDVQPRIKDVVQQLFKDIPTGVGSKKAIGKLNDTELDAALHDGAKWAVAKGYGADEDIARTEEQGCLRHADAYALSDRARKRGVDQMGTLGSGNHFLELDLVEEVYDEAAAAAFGLEAGRVAMQIHCGSRGLGHQVCDDSIRIMQAAVKKYGFDLLDRQLCCAPCESEGGERYMAAMAAAANFAWANRQVIMHLAVRSIAKALRRESRSLGARLVYDVCHNIAKFEEHDVGGARRRLCVHRKGATRAFGPGHPLTPEPYRAVGQPVLIPGDMGTASFVMAGTDKAMAETFGSSCHGAGRVMSRNKAIKRGKGRRIGDELRKAGVYVWAKDVRTLSEEMPEAYKDVRNVVNVMHQAGITRKVARLKPIGVIKG